jgi:type III secretory pathway component EscT
VTGLAAQLATLAPSAASAALHGLRLLPVALFCPFLGGPLVPGVARVGVAFGLGASAWAAAGAPAFGGDGRALFACAARELALGAALAFAAAWPFEAARAAGRLADTLRGATLAELHVAPLRQRESASGDLLAQSLVVLGASAGGDRLVVAALLGGFRALPAGGGAAAAGLLGMGLDAACELLASALCLAAPAAAGVLAADLALALAARAAPGLGVGALAQPARGALGVGALAVAAAAVAGRMTAALASSAAGLAAGVRP